MLCSIILSSAALPQGNEPRDLKLRASYASRWLGRKGTIALAASIREFNLALGQVLAGANLAVRRSPRRDCSVDVPRDLSVGLFRNRLSRAASRAAIWRRCVLATSASS